MGNLPYYITQDFLKQLLPLGHLVSHAVLLLQVSKTSLQLLCCLKRSPAIQPASNGTVLANCMLCGQTMITSTQVLHASKFESAQVSLSSKRFVFQEEAALRLTQTTPGASDFRAMSIETQYYSQATPLFTVPRTEFSPVPDVNGVVVDFALHLPEDRAVHDAQGFLAMVSNQTRLHRFVHFTYCMDLEDHHKECYRVCYKIDIISL